MKPRGAPRGDRPGALPEPQGAILDPTAAARAFRIVRVRPAAPLADHVRHYWFLSWDLRGRPPHDQSTVGHPGVNVVIEAAVDGVYGVPVRRFDRRLEGQGSVFGTLFHPAGFHGFFQASVHTLTGRSVPTRSVFSGDVDALRTGLFGLDPDHDDDGASRGALLDAFFLRDLPPPDPRVAALNAVMATAAADRTLVRAEQLAERVGIGLRTLQRQLRRYVGVGPKWVLRRYRLHDAAERLAAGDDVDQAALAFALGYYDQAHFVRDFTALIGQSPGRYAARGARRPTG
ncbi:MAG: helix-turn-helix domain-containing protein [Myxococcota bacterium]